MKTPKLAIAMGYIDDDLISGAVDYMPARRGDIIHYWKCAVAVAACIVVALGINSYLKQYVILNNIQVQQYDNTEGDTLSCDDMTPELSEKSAKANNMHNHIVDHNLEWYGNCYYDFDSDSVMIGLTENTENNQKRIIEIIGDTTVQFYECKHSYQHLEKIYNCLESRQLLLRILGVKRYNISVIDNYVNVYITSEKNYLAIYMVNKLADEDSAISFKTLVEQKADRCVYIGA